MAASASHFPGRDFTRRYFPARYFPGEGPGTASTGTPWPTMTAALAAALAADATLAAAFRGGFSQGEADRDRRWPYCVFVKHDVKTVYQVLGRRNAVKRATYRFDSLARSGAQAEQLAELLKSRLLPNDGPGGDGLAPFDPEPLAWARGREVSRYAPGPACDGPESTGLAPGPVPSNKDAFQSTVYVCFTVSTW